MSLNDSKRKINRVIVTNTFPSQSIKPQSLAVSSKDTAAKINHSKKKSAVKFSRNSFISVVAILLGLIVLVGILTFVIPAGSFVREYVGYGQYRITDQFVLYPDGVSPNRLPILRWFTAPFEVWGSSYGLNLGFLSLLLLIMGGAFYVIEKTGGMQAIINAIIRRFSKRKYLLIWITTLFFMLLAAIFGSFEDVMILLPIVLMLCKAMRWDNLTGLGMMMLAAGVGLSATLINWFSIGLASYLASALTGQNVSVLTGLWFRIIIFLVFWALTSLFVTFFFARRAERKNAKAGLLLDHAALIKSVGEPTALDKKKVRVFGIFFLVMFAIILICYIPALVSFIMPIMSAAFLIGGIICGFIITGSLKQTLKYFGKGALSIAPAILILMMSFSIKFIAENGGILETMFYEFHSLANNVGPYAAILLIFFGVFFLNFFIPSSSAKVIIIIPLVTLLPIAGLSIEVVILAFLLSEGTTGVFFPTSPVLLVGLSFADVSYFTWFKKTVLFQLAMIVVSCLLLLLAVRINYGYIM